MNNELDIGNVLVVTTLVVHSEERATKVATTNPHRTTKSEQ